MNEELVKKLTSLAQLDRDAMSVYEEALKHVTDDDVKTHFTEFHDEHSHHVTVYSRPRSRGSAGPRSSPRST